MSTSVLRSFMVDFISEVMEIIQEDDDNSSNEQVRQTRNENLQRQRRQELIVVSDNARVQKNQVTPPHPVLETLNCSDSFRELFEVNGGNTRWNGGGSNGSFRVLISSCSGNNNSTESFSSSSSSTTTTACTTSSNSCSSIDCCNTYTPETSSPQGSKTTTTTITHGVPVATASPTAATGSASGAKKVGRWESSTPSPAARSRNAGAGLSFPRRLPDHTDSFQIISRSIRRGGLSVPNSFCHQSQQQHQGTTPCSSHGDEEITGSPLNGSMPLLTPFLADLTPPPPPTPLVSGTEDDDEEDSTPRKSHSSTTATENEGLLCCPSSPGSLGLSREEQNQLMITAMAFQQVQLRYSAESAATAALQASRTYHHKSPQKGVQRASSMPITASSRKAFDKTLRRSFGNGSSRHVQLLSPRPKQHSPLIHATQQSDRITRFVSDVSASSATGTTQRGSAPPICPVRRSDGSSSRDMMMMVGDNSDNKPYQNIAISSPTITNTNHVRLDYGLRRAQSDTLQFRNTSAYYYAPHLQRLKEDEQQEMGKIERRSIVDNSLAFYSESSRSTTSSFNNKTSKNKTTTTTTTKSSLNKGKTINSSNTTSSSTGSSSPNKKKKNHDRWAMEKTKTKVLEEILVQRKPSLNRHFQRKPDLDRWGMEVEKKKSKVLEKILVQRKPSIVVAL